MATAVKYSVLIVGCGAIAGGYDAGDSTGPAVGTHAKAFHLHPGFDLAGCLDRDPVLARDFRDIWGVTQAYPDLDQALRDRNFDVVSICTPTSAHEAGLRRLAGSAVKLVFCEKPLTDRIATAREMAQLFPHMAVNYLRRFDPAIRQLAQDVANHVYGDFLSGKAIYNKGLYNNGSHMVDLLHLLLGPVEVKAARGVIHDFWDQDPTISALLESGAGRHVDLSGTDVRNGMVFDLDLTFEGARIRLTDFSHKLTVTPVAGPERTTRTALDRGMLHAASNIHDHLATGAALHSTAGNALQAMEICGDVRKMAGIAP